VLLVNLLKKSKIRGRGKAIKLVSFFFKKIKRFSYSIPGCETNLILDLSDDAAIGFFLNDGIPHEKGLLSIFEFFADSKKIFWDIGTNYGFYPYIFINNDWYNKIHCFEPNPRLNEILNQSFRGNNRVYIYNFGLGDEMKKMKFNYSDSRSDLGSFTSNSFKKNTQHQIVNIDTIDNIRKIIGKPDIIKIDVEGFEMFVLKGYVNLNVDYPIITVEWIENFQNLKFAELLNLFDSSWNYYYIGNDGRIYCVKNDLCGSDLLFISEKNDNYIHVSQLIN